MFCFRARKQLMPYLEDALDERRAEAVARHLERCPKCSEEAAFLRNASNAFRASRTPAQEPAADLWSRIEREIATVPAPVPARRGYGLQLAGASALAAVLLLVMVNAGRIGEFVSGGSRYSPSEVVQEHAPRKAQEPVKAPADKPKTVNGDPKVMFVDGSVAKRCPATAASKTNQSAAAKSDKPAGTRSWAAPVHMAKPAPAPRVFHAPPVGSSVDRDESRVDMSVAEVKSGWRDAGAHEDAVATAKTEPESSASVAMAESRAAGTSVPGTFDRADAMAPAKTAAPAPALAELPAPTYSCEIDHSRLPAPTTIDLLNSTSESRVAVLFSYP